MTDNNHLPIKRNDVYESREEYEKRLRIQAYEKDKREFEKKQKYNENVKGQAILFLIMASFVIWIVILKVGFN